MKECEEDLPAVRKRPTNIQPDREIINNIEAIYEMVH